MSGETDVIARFVPSGGADLAGELERLGADNQRLRALLAGRCRELGARCGQLAAARSEADGLAAEVKRLRAAARTGDCSPIAEAELAGARADLAKARDKASAARADAANAVVACNVLGKELAAARGELAKARGDHADLMAYARRLQVDLDACRRHIGDLEGRPSRATSVMIKGRTYTVESIPGILRELDAAVAENARHACLKSPDTVVVGGSVYTVNAIPGLIGRIGDREDLVRALTDQRNALQGRVDSLESRLESAREALDD